MEKNQKVKIELLSLVVCSNEVIQLEVPGIVKIYAPGPLRPPS